MKRDREVDHDQQMIPIDFEDSSSLEGSSNDNIVGTDTPALQIPPTNIVNLDRSPTEGSATSDDDFVDVVQTGTPTVLFNPRNRRPRRNLSLSHCSSSYSGTNLQNSPTTERSSFIEIIDSEDEAIETAILESLKEENNSTSGNTNVSLEQALKSYQRTTINESGRSDVIVSRGRVLQSAFRAINRKSFKPTQKLYVKFSGEMGEDYGGPRREFFRLSLKELLNSALFEGQEEEKYFSHDIVSLDEGKYRLAGRLVALSIAQDGPGLYCLHPVLYDLMTDLKPDLSLVSVPVEQQQMIRELKDVDSDSKRDVFLSKHMDWFIDHGFKDIYRQVLNQKDLLINAMMKHHMYYRTLAEITEFNRGLNDVGNFWEVVIKNAELFKSIFCHKPADLCKEVFDGLCQIEFSDVGSNAKAKEDETVYSWEVVLQDIEEEKDPFTFEDLLGFMTGADRIPLCGFDKKIDISFYNQEVGMTRLPSVSTCGLQMWLPRGIREPRDLLSLLETAIKGSQGFHKI